ncbi:24917_t:CDS:1, partial [Gigaspora rosea]
IHSHNQLVIEITSLSTNAILMTQRHSPTPITRLSIRQKQDFQ